MRFQLIIVTAIVTLIVRVHSSSEDDVIEKIPLQSQPTKPLTDILNRKEIRNVNGSIERSTETLSRVKRQYGYGYGRRWYPYPFPLPIFIGGGFGGRGFGGGFGGRGFGGGFGGRGFGGGFGGRGFGGGFGGGRGGVGGGRGGGGGRG